MPTPSSLSVERTKIGSIILTFTGTVSWGMVGALLVVILQANPAYAPERGITPGCTPWANQKIQPED